MLCVVTAPNGKAAVRGGVGASPVLGTIQSQHISLLVIWRHQEVLCKEVTGSDLHFMSKGMEGRVWKILEARR